MAKKTPREKHAASFMKDVKRQTQTLMRDLTNNPDVPDAERDRIAALVNQIKENPQLVHLKAAREKFIEKAADYVELHIKSVRAMYAAGEFESAATHAEWAMKHLGNKQMRVIELPGEEGGDSGGTKIMLGLQIGGQREPEVIDVESTTE